MRGADSRRWTAVWVGYAALLMTLLAACSGPQSFQGTPLRDSRDAQSFNLLNQLGQRISLSDRQGKVVVLTFLYTSCPDVCPIVTSQLRDTYEMLGSSSAQVALVAISVDPRRDSVDAAHAFSQRWEMTDRWDFLVGQEDELAPIWSAYYLDPISDDGRRLDGGHGATEHGEGEGEGSSGAPGQTIDESYLVAHSTPVYLIDRDGVLRVVFTPPLDPKAIVHDVRMLLREREP